ncbi:MAG: amidase family protein, partial [Rubrobacteraceae bacterium]
MDYVAALEERRRFTGAVDEVLREVDVLVCPTAPFAATQTDPDFEGGALDYILRTVPFDVSGHPALSVPAG